MFFCFKISSFDSSASDARKDKKILCIDRIVSRYVLINWTINTHINLFMYYLYILFLLITSNHVKHSIAFYSVSIAFYRLSIAFYRLSIAFYRLSNSGYIYIIFMNINYSHFNNL